MINLKFGLRHGFKNKNNNKNSTYIPQMNQLWQEMKKKKNFAYRMHFKCIQLLIGNTRFYNENINF